WLSSPTPASESKLTLKSRVEVCCAQGGPKQTAEVDHVRMPKSAWPFESFGVYEDHWRTEKVAVIR
ncbi:MAG: hypothetical protein ABSD89_09710, partial [Halobacteriota archaeon]